MADPRFYVAVVEAGSEVQPELDPAAYALDDAQQFSPRIAGAAAAHGAAVVENALAVVGAKGRGQHQGAVDVGPQRRFAHLGGGDRAMAAAVPVEQAPEAAAGIEAPRARPVDRSCPRHQGDGV